MSKLYDLLNDRTPTPRFIVPVEELSQIIEEVNDRQNGHYIMVSCKRQEPESNIVQYARDNGYKAYRVAHGYPYCDTESWLWMYKVWVRDE